MRQRDFTGMEPHEVLDYLRAVAIQTSRAFKELFALAVPRGTLWRWVFSSEEGPGVRRVGERALADLAEYCCAHSTSFDPDPLVMARRAGRRDVWLRITNYLNLDEAQVQQIMENDYGI